MQTTFHYDDQNYTAHPHDMVHITAKFYTLMRFRVTVRKLNVTDRRALQYLPSPDLRHGGNNQTWPILLPSYPLT